MKADKTITILHLAEVSLKSVRVFGVQNDLRPIEDLEHLLCLDQLRASVETVRSLANHGQF